MITFFSHVRPFVGEFDALQRTAISSWKSMGDVQVVLLGKDSMQAAIDLEVDWGPIAGYNENGTALVKAIFEAGERAAKYDLLCEISSDIVLSASSMPAFVAMDKIANPLVVGQRHDVTLYNKVVTLHPSSAVDYFAYRRRAFWWHEMPDFAVGRTAYDNWIMWAANTLWGMDTIDATADIYALHINHGYPEYGDKEAMQQSDERKRNREMAYATGCRTWPGVESTRYIMRKGKVTLR